MVRHGSNALCDCYIPADTNVLIQGSFKSIEVLTWYPWKKLRMSLTPVL